MSVEKLGPFHSISEPRKIAGSEQLGGGTGESVVFEHELEPGVSYIRKRLKYGKKVDEVDGVKCTDDVYPGANIQEVAVNRKRFYEILKKYLGDHIVDTHYVISADENGQPEINIAQKKVEGKTITDMLGSPHTVAWTKDLERLDPSVEKQVREIWDILLNKVQHDPEVVKRFGKQLSPHNHVVKDAVFDTIFNELIVVDAPFHGAGKWDNMMVDKNGKVVIVDW